MEHGGEREVTEAVDMPVQRATVIRAIRGVFHDMFDRHQLLQDHVNRLLGRYEREAVRYDFEKILWCRATIILNIVLLLQLLVFNLCEPVAILKESEQSEQPVCKTVPNESPFCLSLLSFMPLLQLVNLYFAVIIIGALNERFLNWMHTSRIAAFACCFCGCSNRPGNRVVPVLEPIDLDVYFNQFDRQFNLTPGPGGT